MVRALQYKAQRAEQVSTVTLRMEGILGRSPVLLECLNLVARSACSDVNILDHGRN